MCETDLEDLGGASSRRPIREVVISCILKRMDGRTMSCISTAKLRTSLRQPTCNFSVSAVVALAAVVLDRVMGRVLVVAPS